MKIATDLGSNSATLGNGSPDAKMQSHLTPATPEAKTVTSQIEVGTILETDSAVFSGSHGVADHRQQAASVDPLRGNDTPPRGETEGGA